MDNTGYDNIIHLRLRTNLLHNRATLATKSNRLEHVMASGAIATTVLFVTLINLMTLSQNETVSETRNPAAVVPMIDDNDISNWNPSLFSRLTINNGRNTASFSHLADELEQLQFGALEGKYALKLDSGKVSEITYQESAGASDRPKYLKSKEEFLKTYRTSLLPNFATATRFEQKINDDQIVESYQLLDESSTPVAIARFTSDKFGRFMKLKFE